MKKLTYTLSVLALAMGISIAMPVMADSTEQNQTITILTEKANKGDADAQNELGKLYLKNGANNKADYLKAKYWFEKSAAQGNAKAKHNLGMIYYFGVEGIPNNDDKAVDLLEQAATAGIAQSQVLLSLIYIDGLGAKQNTERAQMWFDKAKAQHATDDIEFYFDLVKDAQSGEIKYQHALGQLYFIGEYAPENTEKARQWFEKAALQGDMSSQYMLGVIYYYGGNNVKIDYTKARQWFEKAAKQKSVDAQLKLGIMYLLGQGGKQDLAKGKKWIKKSCNHGLKNGCKIYDNISKTQEYIATLTTKANAGDVESQNELAFVYLAGQYVPKDIEKAVQLLEKSANQGNIDAQSTLGLMYYHGNEIKQDYTKAQYWFEKAANQGDAIAQFSLGKMYDEGIGAQQDYSQAKYWYEKSATQEIHTAQYNLGMLYLEGKGVAKNKNTAKQLFTKACNNGLKDGCNALQDLTQSKD